MYSLGGARSANISMNWGGYSSSTDLDVFRIYYGAGAVDESNVVEVGSSVNVETVSDSSWELGDTVCVEIRSFNGAGEATNQEQCINLS